MNLCESTNKEIQRAARKTDELAEMYKQFDEARDKLNKRVEDGITWEVEKKQDALKETKKAVTEELAIVKKGNIEQLSVKNSTNSSKWKP